ncbi:uncharacterized protein LOC110931967 [Helianthus annuus]|uniref:uncharacterized protein LOC110931967 n=1 Tax=Helianthus annuus TaxID=4232 RepID=UPI000B9016D8|nr:uncharacterized protein LOC110931967 [Helianthus annuus]
MGKKIVAECNDLFESFAHSDIDHRAIDRTSIPVSSTSSAGRGVHQISLDKLMVAALENLERRLTNRMNDLEKRVDRCEVCRGGHDTIDCPTLTVEQVEFIANRGPTNPFNNSNLGSNWRSNTFHLPVQFGSSGSGGQFNSGGSNSQGSNNQDLGSGLDEIKAMLSQILVENQATKRTLEATQRTLEDHAIFLKNNHSNFLDLQRQVSDIDRQLQERCCGQFSGNCQPNTVNHHVKAISTRSGLELRKVGPPPVRIEEEEPMDDEIELEAPPLEKSVRSPVKIVRPSPEIDHAHAPYPERLKNQKFLDMFKQFQINLPLIEALKHMPKYAKFLKEILKGKDKLEEISNVSLNVECSVVVMNSLPEKLTDPGIFMIPCLFGGDVQNHALADLGASINLMPYSFYEKLGLGDLKSTRMTLSLADKTVKYPRGIVENLLVKVDKFVFPMDFVVLDMEADENVLLILERPFLNTSKALIDVYLGTITLRAGEESVVFKVTKSRGSNDRVEAVVSVGKSGKDMRSEKEVVNGPSLEEAIGPKCGDPPDRRVKDLEKRVKRFKPPDDELRGCERYGGVWGDSGNYRYDGAIARESWYGGELRLHDPP